MATASTQVQSAVDTVRSAQTALNGQQGEMMAGWVGNAASAFTNAFTSFNQDYTAVINSLQRIQEALTANAKNYTVAEESNTQLSTKVSSALNH